MGFPVRVTADLEPDPAATQIRRPPDRRGTPRTGRPDWRREAGGVRHPPRADFAQGRCRSERAGLGRRPDRRSDGVRGLHGVPSPPGVGGGRAGSGLVSEETHGPAVSQARRRPGSAPDHAGLRRPPEGRATWTMRLLADRLVELAIVDTISPECVRTTLKKRAQAVAAEAMGDSAPG